MSSTFTIRRADPHEAELLSDLGVRSKAVWNYSADAMATFRDELRLTESQIATGSAFVITVADEVLGYYTLQQLDTDTVELQHLFVDPNFLKCGHGSRLLDHALTQARSDGYHRLVIQSDPNAAGFYLKRGIPKIKEIPSSIPGRTIPYFEIVLSSTDSKQGTESADEM